jgi:hypothetical protein
MSGVYKARLLAVLGNPGDEKSGAVVIMQDGERIYEALTGESISSDELALYIEQCRGYLANLERALQQS